MTAADAPLVGAGMLGRDFFVETSDGRMLRAMSRGEGDDLVVLEAGLGASGLSWGPVHDAIAGSAHVVAYERAGYGASTPDPAPRTLERLTDDLLAVIRAVPHRRLVLVGHSWGGLVVRSTASRLSERGESVHGLVLVDASDENADLYFTHAVRFAGQLYRFLLPPLRVVGLLRPLARAMLRPLPEPVRSASVDASTTREAARETGEEYRWVASGMRGLREHPIRLPASALTVITGMRHGRADAKQRAQINAAHRASAAQHPAGRLVEATGSDHLIPFTEPQLIADEALRMLRD